MSLGGPWGPCQVLGNPWEPVKALKIVNYAILSVFMFEGFWALWVVLEVPDRFWMIARRILEVLGVSSGVRLGSWVVCAWSLGGLGSGPAPQGSLLGSVEVLWQILGWSPMLLVGSWASLAACENVENRWLYILRVRRFVFFWV